MRRRRYNNEDILGPIIMLFLLMAALPIFGFIEFFKGDLLHIIWGIFLIMAGVGFWVWFAFAV